MPSGSDYVPPTPQLWSTLQGALGEPSASAAPPSQCRAIHDIAASARDYGGGDMQTYIQDTPHFNPVSVDGWPTSTAPQIQMGQPEMHYYPQAIAYPPSQPSGCVPLAYEHQARDSVYTTSSPYTSTSYADHMYSAYGYLQADGLQRPHRGVQYKSPYSSPPNERRDVTDDDIVILRGGSQRTNVRQYEDASVGAESEPKHTRLAVVSQLHDQLECGWEGCNALFDMDLQALKVHFKTFHRAKNGERDMICRFRDCESTEAIRATNMCRHYQGHMIRYRCECGMIAKSSDHFKDEHGKMASKIKGREMHSFTGKAEIVWETKVAALDYRIRRT